MIYLATVTVTMSQSDPYVFYVNFRAAGLFAVARNRSAILEAANNVNPAN